MPFGGLVVNRVHQPPSRCAAGVGRRGPRARRWPSACRSLPASSRALAARDAANVERLRDALGDPPTIVVPELADDVHDLEGLALVRSHLFE